MSVTINTSDIIETMDKLKKKMHDKALEKIIKDITCVKEYHHKPTNIHARIMAYRVEHEQLQKVVLSSTALDKSFIFNIKDEDLFHRELHSILDEYFAKHVLEFIMGDTETKLSTEEAIRGLINAKRY